MSKIKFSKPPLTLDEKEKKAEDFINFADKTPIAVKENPIATKKESIKAIYLRAPQSFYDDIQEIMILTGLTMNGVCLELLRPALKKKLKELKES